MSSLTPYKGRTASAGQRVKTYYNLHRGGYSVVAADGPDKGLVIAHAEELLLVEVTFVVSEAGRQRVIREKRKNVHAYAVGNLIASLPLDEGLYMDRCTRLHYNPYKLDSFYYIDDDGFRWQVHGAGVVYLNEHGCFGGELTHW